jgi:hypothetical protein
MFVIKYVLMMKGEVNKNGSLHCVSRLGDYHNFCEGIWNSGAKMQGPAGGW